MSTCAAAVLGIEVGPNESTLCGARSSKALPAAGHVEEERTAAFAMNYKLATASDKSIAVVCIVLCNLQLSSECPSAGIK